MKSFSVGFLLLLLLILYINLFTGEPLIEDDLIDPATQALPQDLSLDHDPSGTAGGNELGDSNNNVPGHPSLHPWLRRM